MIRTNIQEAMTSMANDGGDQLKKLANFLLMYRTTPHATTSEAPAMLLTRRIPQSCLDFVRPNIAVTAEQKQATQKRSHDQHATDRNFKGGRESG